MKRRQKRRQRPGYVGRREVRIRVSGGATEVPILTTVSGGEQSCPADFTYSGEIVVPLVLTPAGEDAHELLELVPPRLENVTATLDFKDRQPICQALDRRQTRLRASLEELLTVVAALTAELLEERFVGELLCRAVREG